MNSSYFIERVIHTERFEYYSSAMDTREYLAHHGVKGQKWGVRRYQNKDGSRTALGRKHEAQLAGGSGGSGGSSSRSGGSKRSGKKGMSTAKKVAIGAAAGLTLAAGAALYAKNHKAINGAIRNYAGNAKDAIGRKANSLATKASMKTRALREDAEFGVKSGIGKIKNTSGYQNASRVLGNARARAEYDVKSTASRIKGAARDARDAVRQDPRFQKANSAVKGAAYEALGRADNAVQAAKGKLNNARAQTEYDVKSTVSRLKGAARNARDAVRQDPRYQKANSAIKGAAYEALGRADNAAQAARSKLKNARAQANDLATQWGKAADRRASQNTNKRIRQIIANEGASRIRSAAGNASTRAVQTLDKVRYSKAANAASGAARKVYSGARTAAGAVAKDLKKTSAKDVGRALGGAALATGGVAAATAYEGRKVKRRAAANRR